MRLERNQREWLIAAEHPGARRSSAGGRVGDVGFRDHFREKVHLVTFSYIYLHSV